MLRFYWFPFKEPYMTISLASHVWKFHYQQKSMRICLFFVLFIFHSILYFAVTFLIHAFSGNLFVITTRCVSEEFKIRGRLNSSIVEIVVPANQYLNEFSFKQKGICYKQFVRLYIISKRQKKLMFIFFPIEPFFRFKWSCLVALAVSV